MLDNLLNTEYFIKNTQQTCMVESRVQTERTIVSSNIKYNEIMIVTWNKRGLLEKLRPFLVQQAYR